MPQHEAKPARDGGTVTAGPQRIELRGQRIAVTGATGFIGRYLVRALLARGARVVAVVRTPSKVHPAVAAQVEVRQADLRAPSALRKALVRCDALLANAGLVSIGGVDRRTLIDTNLEGTRNTLRAAAAGQISRVILTSSAAAYRPKWSRHYREGDPLRAESDFTTRLGWYALSKACSERAAWDLCRDYGIGLSTVRPFVVFGAHDNVSFTMWLRRFMCFPISVFPYGVKLPAIYAGDLAEAVCRMLERPVAVGRAYNLAGASSVDFWQLYQAYRRAGGDTPRVVVPLPIPFTIRMAADRARRDLDFVVRSHASAFADMLRIEA